MFLPRCLRPRGGRMSFAARMADRRLIASQLNHFAGSFPDDSPLVLQANAWLDNEERAARNLASRPHAWRTTGPIPRNDDALYDRGDPHPYDYTDMRFSERGDSQG